MRVLWADAVAYGKLRETNYSKLYQRHDLNHQRVCKRLLDATCNGVINSLVRRMSVENSFRNLVSWLVSYSGDDVTKDPLRCDLHCRLRMREVWFGRGNMIHPRNLR